MSYLLLYLISLLSCASGRRREEAQCRWLQHRHRRGGTGYVPLQPWGVLVTSSQQDLIHHADSAGLHFFTIPSPAEGSTNSTWPRKGQAKVTRELLFFWTSCGGRHEAASGVHPPFGCVQMRESEREAEAQFAVLTFYDEKTAVRWS